MVSELKKKAELSGNDFLPMVLKLDDLMQHLRGVREMASRLTALKDTVPGAAAATAPQRQPPPGPPSSRPLRPSSGPPPEVGR